MTEPDETLADEARRYLRFDAAAAAGVVALAPRLRPHLERVAHVFYERIHEHEGARAVLRDEAQERRLHRSLVRWLDDLVSGPHDAAHFERTARVGRVHAEVGLPQRYMTLAMSVLRVELGDRARGGPDGAAAARALDTLLDTELAVMIESYHRHFDDRARTLSSGRVAERLASVGLLASGLAHEIRNPLNGAHLHATFLARELTRTGAPAELLDAVRTIDGELARLSALVTEFLQLGRPHELSREPTALRDVVLRAHAILRPEAEARGIVLRADVPDAPVLVSADADRLEQVVLNLGRNAIEAAPRATGHVVLRARPAAPLGVIEVEDDGPGVTPPDAPIFDAFFSTKAGGTGLGLAIAHRVVTEHAGTLVFESVPGRTLFTASFPLDAGLAPEPT